ncbi:tyrosine-type recombinase/integrase [Acidithiobacillus caldus]|uniref:tyrosine-type recombinase/integrase n=1 Tax=Acidithiobacillus caldus TaxID=33059 RepID=UPI001C0738C6|nr:site-specific integrase [Acidithiobacillus caldus]MBU2770135.1 site-specific integrase [Acidithiobacillus caldus]
MAGFYEQRDREGNLIGWQAKVRKKGYPTQTKVFRSKREAQEWAAVVESEMARGVWRDRSEAENTTLSECIERYLREVTPAKKNCRPEELRLKQWLRRPVSRRFMASIRGKDIADAIRAMETEGKSPNTIRLHLAVLSHLFTVAQSDWGMEAIDNPVARVRKPRVPRGRERRLLPGEMGALLGAAEMRFACLIALVLETGMRREEVASLHWENVNLKSRSIFLPKTKNGEARTIPLSPASVEILSMIDQKSAGSVFGLTAEGIDSAWDRARIAVGIPSGWGGDALHFHDLRHEATSRFFERTDLDLMEIRAITGHKSMQMLARYTHLRTANLADRLAGGKRGG